ncbi:hypothetical protein [Pseudemcibacter aquimaris]|uniref:hypothetical protein n=1 Tax=Pseudemcibacter aquimaris TaxID=2857064 RepID=UPI0020133CC0|nr:hypothetical protein [Pseudemcibacter aquimaris]MCC3860058.1 hypothetical protein [Pseudemcibacter aquimaris]WDU57388.1 FG-GAP repeat protein [Pseudemcibacter aquimaris]
MSTTSLAACGGGERPIFGDPTGDGGTGTGTGTGGGSGGGSTGILMVEGTAVEDQVLELTGGISGVDADEPITYEWLRDGVPIVGATENSYTLTQADVGTIISSSVTYTDTLGNIQNITFTGTTAVENVNDDPVGEVTITGTPTEGETLLVSNTIGDEDGLGVISYQWQRDGVDVLGATNTTYELTQDDTGSVITVVASYTDDYGTDETVVSEGTSAVLNVNNEPTGEVIISGTATEDETLTVSNTIDDVDGLGTITYQWQRDGVDVEDATTDSYTLTQDDVGATMTVVATYTDGEGTVETVTSDNTSAVLNVSHSTTGTVTIAGSATEGATLIASNTLADEDGLGAITYQWQSDGVDIAGATGVNYYLTQDDVGSVITVVASHTDGEGTLESVSSFSTDEVTELSALQLSTLDGRFGFRLDGDEIDGQVGWSVSGAGDFNGDGYDDLIIGANLVNADGTDTGASYVLFGSNDNYGADGILGTPYSLSNFNGINGFRLDGVGEGDESGFSVSNAGDVNGDGYDDLLIGAYAADPNGDLSGSSYVVFGNVSFMGASFDLSSLDGTNGFRIDGEAVGDESGYSVSNAGDVNGDGFDDIIISAPSADPNGDGSGSSYVVFGQTNWTANSGVFDLSSIDGSNGFRLDGAAVGDASGYSVSNAGDVNGDGYDDVIVSAYSADPNGNSSGSTYVVFGDDDWTAGSGVVDLSSINGTNGFRLDGEAADDESGYSVSSAGDFNGDGFDDMVVGARYTDNNGNASGSTYVVFGAADWTAGSGIFDLSTLDGTTGFRLDGEAAGDESGYSVSNLGDINDDGFDDIIVGAYAADPNGDDSGSSYVLFGTDTGIPAVFDFEALDGTNGFRIDGETAGDQSGWSVSGAGDLNGDGYDDFIVGAHGIDSDGANSGSAYVIYGGTQWSYSVEDCGEVVTGDNANNVLIGTFCDDIIYGLDGDDILKGGSGQDTLYGGKGIDQLYGGGNYDIFVFEPGETVITISGVIDDGVITGYDTIYDFEVGDGTNNSEAIDISVEGHDYLASDMYYLNFVITDGNGFDSSLTIDGSTIKSHSIVNGVISFDDQDDFTEALEISTNSDIAAVVEYLQRQNFVNPLLIDDDHHPTVAFDVGADTFIFSQGHKSGEDSLDMLIRLEGVQVDSLSLNEIATEFGLYIL